MSSDAPNEDHYYARFVCRRLVRLSSRLGASTAQTCIAAGTKEAKKGHDKIQRRRLLEKSRAWKDPLKSLRMRLFSAASDYPILGEPT